MTTSFPTPSLKFHLPSASLSSESLSYSSNMSQQYLGYYGAKDRSMSPQYSSYSSPYVQNNSRSPSPTYSTKSSYSSYSYHSAPPVQPQHPRLPTQKPIKPKYWNGNGNGNTNLNANANPFSDLVPTYFPTGLDKKVVKAFQAADRDGNGFIDEKELKAALGSCGLNFSTRTVRFIMSNFTKSKARLLGPLEFSSVYSGLQEWKAIFQRSDKDRNGTIDTSELRQALQGLGLQYPISRAILDSLVLMFDKNGGGGGNMGFGFESFIECCLTVKGLTKKFQENDTSGYGEANFTYEEFMLAILPFLVA